MHKIRDFRPVNRHLVIIPHSKDDNKTNTGVLLPEDYEPEKNRYITATVTAVAKDCMPQLKDLGWRGSGNGINDVIVDSTMIEKVKLPSKTLHLILENYVLGFFTELE